MARSSEYSHYRLHVCSHMRLVVHAWLPVYPRRYNEQTGELVCESAWFHVDKDGMLLQQSPCQASIHRVEHEWPQEATRLDHMLVGEKQSDGKTRLNPTPSTRALYQLHPAE